MSRYVDTEYTLKEATNYIRKNGTPDYIKVDGILFTMDWYDMDGKEIYYGNKTESTGIDADKNTK